MTAILDFLTSVKVTLRFSLMVFWEFRDNREIPAYVID